MGRRFTLRSSGCCFSPLSSGSTWADVRLLKMSCPGVWGIGPEANAVHHSSSAGGAALGLLSPLTILVTSLKDRPAKEGNRERSSCPSCSIVLLSAPLVPMQAAQSLQLAGLLGMLGLPVQPASLGGQRSNSCNCWPSCRVPSIFVQAVCFTICTARCCRSQAPLC